MNTRIVEQIKQGVIVLTVGAVASMIPFYFKTNAMTEQNSRITKEQGVLIEKTINDLQALEVKGAVDGTEIKQIKTSLERIEKKIDRLIEKRN